MSRIARDEARHASLAWAVAAWAETVLPRASCRRVREMERAALATLGSEIARGWTDDAAFEVLGLPPPLDARALLLAMTAARRRHSRGHRPCRPTSP